MTLSIFSVCLIYDHMHDFLAKGLLLQQLNTVVRQRVFGLEHMYFTVQPIRLFSYLCTYYQMFSSSVS